MIRKYIALIIPLVFLVSLNGCSTAPGIPGIKVPPPKSATSLKNGVDYKLVVINAQTIHNQRPFNVKAFIQNKRKRSAEFSSYTAIPALSQHNIANRNLIPANYSEKNSPSKHLSSSSLNLNNNKKNYKYHIGKKDVLSITVWDHPELKTSESTGHIVNSAGHVYFPYAGNIYVVGKTASEVKGIIVNNLMKYITKPQVTVQISAFRSQKAYISGAINTTILPITDTPLTIRDAISSAGGVSLNGTTGFATLSRGDKTIIIDLKRLLKFSDNRQNYLLKSGDRLRIHKKDEYQKWLKGLYRAKQTERALNPIRLQYELQKVQAVAQLNQKIEEQKKSQLAKVFVMGEVRKPGSKTYKVTDGMTLAEAINDSGSFNETTVNPQGVFLIRQESKKDKIPTVYQLPLASVHSILLAEQFEVRPRDIIYVTTTSSIRWNRILSQLIPSLTLVNTVTNLTR